MSSETLIPKEKLTPLGVLSVTTDGNKHVITYADTQTDTIEHSHKTGMDVVNCGRAIREAIRRKTGQ